MRTLLSAWTALALTGCTDPSTPSASTERSADAAAEDAGADGEAGDSGRVGSPCGESWGEAPSSKPHWIAFDGLGELRMIDIADPSSTPVSVTARPEPGESMATLEPGWSADGRWFAFRTAIDDGWALYAVEVVNDELSSARAVLKDQRGTASFDDFRWSPQGAWLAYTEHSGDDTAPHSRLMLRDLEADEPIAAWEGRRLGGLKWAPDGSMLTLGDQDSGMGLLVRVDDEGQVATHELQLKSGIWSPDSRFVATIDEGLHVYETQSNPPRATTLNDVSNPASVEWSDDGRFVVTQRYVEMVAPLGVVIEAYDTHDLTAEAREVTATSSEHGETPFSILGDPDVSHSPHFAFVPGEHAIVVAMDEGWTYVPLRDELGEPRVIAPLDAGIVGFSDARELLWIDANGIYATTFDGGAARVVLALQDPRVHEEHGSRTGQNTVVAPKRDRLAVAQPDYGSAFDLLLIEGCQPEHVTFEQAYRWSGLFLTHGYPWAWLADGRSLVQQTETANHSGVTEDDQHAARLELVRIASGRVEVRTLLEAPIQHLTFAFEWREQPY